MRFNKSNTIKASFEVYLFTLFVLCVCTSSVKATALSPFIDLQEKGLTVVSGGVGLVSFSGTTKQITVNVGGPVRFALLYWAGRDRPCNLDASGTNCTYTQPYKDQQMIFNGTALTGTVIGNETQPATGGGPILNIGYYADVTSIVAAAGTGSKTFNIQDGDTNSNLWRLDGMSLIVGYTDSSNQNTYRVLVSDGLDFAYGDDPTPGATRVTAPVVFNHGAAPVSRSADVLVIAGEGDSSRPDNITFSNNPTVFNSLNSSSGAAWDNDLTPINVPSGVSSTTVQVNSQPVGQNPDSLLWEAVLLRVQVPDTTPPTVTVTTTRNGPPFQVDFKVQDTDTGLASIVVTQSNNADTPVPPFTVGTTAPVTITSTKIDQSKPMLVSLRVTDVAGNVTNFTYTDAPTAATVSISGRVTTAEGRGIKNVQLSLIDSKGNNRTATTSSFGFYQFNDVEVGETYILSAAGKHYTFNQPVQVLNISNQTDEVNFIANSEKKDRFF